jgi:hypothetical protein
LLMNCGLLMAEWKVAELNFLQRKKVQGKVELG